MHVYVFKFQTFAKFPDTLEELDEAIHSLQTRIDCLAAVDSAVSVFMSLRSYHLSQCTRSTT